VTSQEKALQAFAQFAGKLKGDEKREAEEEKGKPITPPGLPKPCENRGQMITTDCIEPTGGEP
jgi:hypothetical protein